MQIQYIFVLAVTAAVMGVEARAPRERPLLPVDNMRKAFLRLEDELSTTVANSAMASNEIAKNSIPLDLVLIRKMQGFDVKLQQVGRMRVLMRAGVTKCGML